MLKRILYSMLFILYIAVLGAFIAIKYYNLPNIFTEFPIKGYLPFKKLEKEVVVYIPSWSNVNLNRLLSYDFTHIQLAFLAIKNNRITYLNEVEEANIKRTLKKFSYIKRFHPEVRLTITVGSNYMSNDEFSDMVANPMKRAVFIQSVSNFLKVNNLDGITIDWEYPKTKADKVNFVFLMKELRKEFDYLKLQTKKNYYLSFSIPISRWVLNIYDFKALNPYIDAIEMMAYDLVGGYSSSTGHNANLYANDKDAWSSDDGVKMLLNLGIPQEKLLLGVAFYGLQFNNISSLNNGLYQKNTKLKAKYISYGQIYKNYMFNPDYKAFYDKYTASSYLYSEKYKTFITYSSPKSMASIANYALKNDLRGIMVWHVGQDSKENSLLNVIVNVFKQQKN